jgi:hypothetical protein
VTTAEKRRRVAAILNAMDADGRLLTDREISRRVGVSPTTVGNVRRASAGRMDCPLKSGPPCGMT